MRILLQLPIWLILLTAHLYAGAIQFQVTNLGQNSYRYNYSIIGFVFQQNEEVDIRFAPSLYGTLSNGVAGNGFNVLLLQPNNPPGTFGDYSALSTVNQPSLVGPFSVDFIYNGIGSPGSQPYFINQYDQNGRLVSTVEQGITTPANATATPEPEDEPPGVRCVLASHGFQGVPRCWLVPQPP